MDARHGLGCRALAEEGLRPVTRERPDPEEDENREAEQNRHEQEPADDETQHRSPAGLPAEDY